MVQSLLRDLQSAAAEDDHERVVDLTATVMDRFEEQRQREAALEKMARLVRGSANGTASEAAQSLLTERANLNQARISLDNALLAMIQGSNVDLQSSINDAIAALDSFDATAETLRAEISGLDIPPAVGITVPDQVIVPKAQMVSGAITVRNDGSTNVENLSVTLDSDADISLANNSVDSLSAGETTSVELVGTPTASGQHRPTVSVSGDEVSDDARFYLHVLSKGRYLAQAVEDLTQLYSEVAFAAAQAMDGANGEGAGGASGSGGNRKTSGDVNSPDYDTSVPPGLDMKFRTVTKRTFDVLDRIESGHQTTAINNQIDAIRNQLGTLANQLDAFAGKQLPANEVPRLQRDVDAIREVYADAIRAER